MPIRREHRFFYPIDWRELSRVVRFDRAGGRCEGCGMPHKHLVYHLGDGRWWDAERRVWNGGPVAGPDMVKLRRTYIVLATAHRNHDTADNRPVNLVAWCQICHMRHDRPEHTRRRAVTYRLRRAVGDLFSGPHRV